MGGVELEWEWQLLGAGRGRPGREACRKGVRRGESLGEKAWKVRACVSGTVSLAGGERPWLWMAHMSVCGVWGWVLTDGVRSDSGTSRDRGGEARGL